MHGTFQNNVFEPKTPPILALLDGKRSNSSRLVSFINGHAILRPTYPPSHAWDSNYEHSLLMYISSSQNLTHTFKSSPGSYQHHICQSPFINMYCVKHKEYQQLVGNISTTVAKQGLSATDCIQHCKGMERKVWRNRATKGPIKNGLFLVCSHLEESWRSDFLFMSIICN